MTRSKFLSGPPSRPPRAAGESGGEVLRSRLRCSGSDNMGCSPFGRRGRSCTRAGPWPEIPRSPSALSGTGAVRITTRPSLSPPAALAVAAPRGVGGGCSGRGPSKRSQVTPSSLTVPPLTSGDGFPRVLREDGGRRSDPLVASPCVGSWLVVGVAGPLPIRRSMLDNIAAAAAAVLEVSPAVLGVPAVTPTSGKAGVVVTCRRDPCQRKGG